MRRHRAGQGDAEFRQFRLDLTGHGLLLCWRCSVTHDGFDLKGSPQRQHRETREPVLAHVFAADMWQAGIDMRLRGARVSRLDQE